MTPKSLILLSAAALALTACGRGGDDASSANAEQTAIENEVLGSEETAALEGPAPNSAQGFVNAAAASDRFEIESSRLASASGQSAAVKNFADNMIKAHTASSEKLKTTAAGLPTPVTIDNTLTAEQQSLLDGLKGKTGTEFDAAYSAAQVAAHQKTLDMLNAYSSGGDTPALKELANGLIPTVKAHLNTAKGLK